MSFALLFISIASTHSAIKSPAFVPTIAAPIIFFDCLSNKILVIPSSLASASDRPFAAQGKTPFP